MSLHSPLHTIKVPFKPSSTLYSQPRYQTRMVVANTISVERSEKLPIIDLSGERSKVSSLIVKACEEFGFFKVINHGVGEDVVGRMEDQSLQFFRKPACQKHQAGPPNPYGYGCKNIGFNGDYGEVEYLILHTSPASNSISNHPSNFSSAVKDYIEALRELACNILELMAEGLHIQDTSVFSTLIKDIESDSVFRLNHYPSLSDNNTSLTPSFSNVIGFGEHTDPQILTILKSNDVSGLQVSSKDGEWVPISPQPHFAFFVNVGDILQALTNGRFMSVRHRVMVSSEKTRMSMGYFGAPPLSATISCPSELVMPQSPRLYRAFTWAEYKKATYARRLGDNRLHLFSTQLDDANEII